MSRLAFTELAILFFAICAPACVPQAFGAEGYAGSAEVSTAETPVVNVSLRASVGDSPAKVVVEVSNFSGSTLWFPLQVAPTYRANRQSRVLEIWFGYFEEVYARLTGHYMLPAMHPVQPGEKFVFELASPSLIEGVLEAKKIRVKARVATMALKSSRIRNEQPLDDYISNSIVFDSEGSD
ncbi:hypothetical protein ACLB90_02855 [Stenotrophomonas sp. LGBM10]|uniref:hypothetical protein n=1 Tax=Stenotrophomonas sp. LGBM10 TaxID=3390038 RepID=UPI00398B7484